MPPEGRARFLLAFALILTGVAAGRGEEPSGTPPPEQTWDVADAAPAHSLAATVDGVSVRFSSVRAEGLTAAAAHLGDCTVQLSGRFEPSGIELETVRDITRYFT